MLSFSGESCARGGRPSRLLPVAASGLQGTSARRLQAKLTTPVDDCVAEWLVQWVRWGQRWEEARRLQEVSDPGCSHDWLWGLDPHKGPVLSHQEYVTAVRLRLGAAGPDEPVRCGNCGEAMLSTSASHALCCAKGPSTRGHYAVRDRVHAFACSADPSAETAGGAHCFMSNAPPCGYPDLGSHLWLSGGVGCGHCRT